MDFVRLFLIGAVLAVFLTDLAVQIFPRIKLLDFPERYGLKRVRLPYPGGIVFLLASFGIFFLDPKFWILAPAILVLGAVSFWDDRRQLPAWFRLLVHVGIAAGLFFAGVKIDFIGDPFHATNFELAQYPIFSFIITVGWIVIIQNAMNWFDGLRGLAPGVSAIGFLALGILGLIRPELFFDPAHTNLTLANFYFAGVAAGGFWFFWRGKIILGDTGSQILGFLLAVMSIFSGAKIATTLLVLGLPILDAVVVVVRRAFLEKRSPFHGDQRHLHHNLAKKLGESNAVLALLGISLGLGTIAVFFQGFGKMIALIVVVIFILGLSSWIGRRSKEKS